MDGHHRENGVVGVKMPAKYVAEMVMDRIAASKVYKKRLIRTVPLWNTMSGRKNILQFIRRQERCFIKF